MRDVLSSFSFLVFAEWISAFVQQHFSQFLVAEASSIVEWSDVVETSCIDIRAVLDKKLCEVVVTVICGFMQRRPTWNSSSNFSFFLKFTSIQITCQQSPWHLGLIPAPTASLRPQNRLSSRKYAVRFHHVHSDLSVCRFDCSDSTLQNNIHKFHHHHTSNPPQLTSFVCRCHLHQQRHLLSFAHRCRCARSIGCWCSVSWWWWHVFLSHLCNKYCFNNSK